MEISLFAEQILLSGSVQSKCYSSQEVFTDKNPKGLNIPLSLPVREKSISFNWDKKSDFPSISRLHIDIERGRVLHAFANHELLALELMANVLLKFPDAPPQFRMGLANIMREEQRHMRLYINRMQELGVKFGEEALSGFFWKTLSQPKDIMQFTSQMNLTLEQANLDHCLYYESIFKELGDAKTAGIMQTVLDDELGHVKHGVTWFNKWRSPNMSQWESYLMSLPQGFSAMRAKGKMFSTALREQIGFEPDFIENLKVFSQSKGRAPRLLWFHPFVELELAAGNKNISLPKIKKALENDLSLVPMYYAATDDAVLVNSKPSSQFLSKLSQCGFLIPEFVTNEDLKGRRLRSFAPWGWSIKAHKLLKNVEAQEGTSFFENEPVAPEYYSKAFGAQSLSEFLNQNPDLQNVLTDTNSLGRICQSWEDVKFGVDYFRANGYEKFVLKQEFGLSGGNHIIFTSLDPNLKITQKMILEPWLEKVFDFSFQFTLCEEKTLKKLGLVRFLTNDTGKYRGALLGGFHQRLDKDTIRFVNQNIDERPLIEGLFFRMESFLNSKLKTDFRPNAVGVDAFVYRSQKGELKIRPIVEINPRYNMGTVTSKIESRLVPRRVGQWLILSLSDIKKQGFNNFKEFARHMEQTYPIKTQNVGRPQIDCGVLFTTDPDRAENFISVLEVIGTD